MALGLPLHGGDIAAAEARWGRPAEGWLDLSTGINPWPYPLPALPPEAWTRLPGTAEERALVMAAAGHYGVAGPEQVLAAPGSSPLIQALPRLLPPGPVAVVGPTYAEHARAWSAAGHQVAEVADIDATGDALAVVVVNPNNPDGRVVEPARLVALADRLAALGGLLVVDEAFGDTMPKLSVAPSLRPGLVVLRSFGKFFGLPGLRLGFALAEVDLIGRLGAALGPWPVSGPALAVGAKALADTAWAAATRGHLAFEAKKLDAVLEKMGASVLGGTPLFRLVDHADGPVLYDRLGRAGILVRAFADRPRQLRVGLPPGEKGRARLLAAVRTPEIP